MARETDTSKFTPVTPQGTRPTSVRFRPHLEALCMVTTLVAGGIGIDPAWAASVVSPTGALSDADLAKAADSLQHGPLATLPLEVFDAQHRVQVLPTLGAVASRLADRKVYCRDLPIDDTLHNIRCTQTDLREGVADFALLTKVENGRFLVVSTFDSAGESVGGKAALDTLYLAATGTSAPTTSRPARWPNPRLRRTPPHLSRTRNRSARLRPSRPPTTAVSGPSSTTRRSDMGSLAGLDGFTRQIGGQCYIRTGAEGHAAITCRFPDSRTHRTHELFLEGDGDGADCYGITHTALDGRTLPYAQYVRVFVDHR